MPEYFDTQEELEHYRERYIKNWDKTWAELRKSPSIADEFISASVARYVSKNEDENEEN